MKQIHIFCIASVPGFDSQYLIYDIFDCSELQQYAFVTSVSELQSRSNPPRDFGSIFDAANPSLD